MKGMPKPATRLSWTLFMAFTLGGSPGYPCSTFMISRDECLVVAHNLDQEFFTPGMIHVNRRSEKKRSVSLFDLKERESRTPIAEWTSTYGSVTIGMLGRNLPDGGMNEVGLTVSEMALGESEFAFDQARPSVLSHLWIQYQLDNHASVKDVLEHLLDFNIEPGSTFTPPASANYHFFITDRDGHYAIIEFLKGGPRVYFDGSAPVPVLCNATYPSELRKFERHQGVVGWIRRNLNTKQDLRFVTGALAVESYDPDQDEDPVIYSFATLRAMQFESTKQWSVVYDVRNRRVYFEAAQRGRRGYFDLENIDFDPDARPRVLEDIDLDRSGDVSGQFVEFSPDIDRSVISSFLRSLVQFVAMTDDPAAMDSYMMQRYGFAVERYIDRALETSELIRIGER